MAETFHAQVLTPDGSLFEGDVRGVQVPGVQGSFEIRADHAPIISTLGIGHIRIEGTRGEPHYLAVTGGLVEMSDNRMTLLAEVAERVEDIDVERAMRAKKRAMDQLFKPQTDRLSAESALRRAENRLQVIDMQKRGR